MDVENKNRVSVEDMRHVMLKDSRMHPIINV